LRESPLGGWLPVGEELCATWTWPGVAGGPGVLLLPPIGYDYSSGHRLLVALGRELSDRGATVLTLDYPGTGDSSGRRPTLPAWQDSLRAAAEHIRSTGVSSLALVGLGWGGSLALQAAEALGADAVVALAAALSGRRYVRQLRLLGAPYPDDSGDVSVGGYALPAELLGALSEVTVAPPPGRPVLLVQAHGAPGRVGDVTTWQDDALVAALERPAEDAEVDPRLVTSVAAWLFPETLRPVAGTGTTLLAEAQLDGMTETFVQLGPEQLPGVLTLPSEPRGLLVLLNSGSDPHPGPGRAWVELARATATDHAWAVLRFDARGWGKAQPGPGGDARPYDPHQLEDLRGVLTDLRGRGWSTIVVAGLCAGAWMALQAARTEDVDGAIALNSQLYWAYGDPVEALLEDSVARRHDEILAIRAGADDGRWDAEDRAGLRNAAGAWLDALRDRGQPVELLFAGEDPGLVYLHDRLRLRVQAADPVVRIVQLTGVDHGMQQIWARQRVFDAVGRALSRWDTGPAPADR
jgi:dienelactone hydrolase